MPTSQDLVPTGREYGARQQTVQQMRAAGLPLSSEGGGPKPPGAGGAELAPRPAAPPAPGPQTAQQIAQFDVLAERQPEEVLSTAPPRQVAFERVRQSDNGVLQSIFERMQGYREG